MLVSSLASGWGGIDHNSHAFELPQNPPDYDYCMITFEARHYRDSLSWKLRDRSGFDYDLPYLFKKGDIDRRLNVSKFTVRVYGSQSQSNYKYECSLKYWSKDLLKMPIAKYYSITTVEIAPTEEYKEPPKARARRKGEQDWKPADGARVTFDNTETVHECQLYYQLLNGIEVSSPIMEIKCLWDQFDIAKDCFIDYEELILRGKLSVSFDEKHLYNTSYTATLRHLDNNESNTSDNEIIVRSDVKDMKLTPGGNYEYKMAIEGLNVSYTRTIHVPLIVSVDRMLWTELFGDADQVTFHRYNSTLGTFWTNFHEGESTYVQTGVENTYLTLYKNGTFHYKFHAQPFNPGEPDNLITFGGSFAISILCSNIKRIDLLQLYKSKTNQKPAVMSPVDRAFSPLMPEALKLPEIVRIIAYNTYDDIQSIAKESFNERLKKFRLVSKLWSQAIQPTITGTVTSNFVRIFGVDIARK